MLDQKRIYSCNMHFRTAVGILHVLSMQYQCSLYAEDEAIVSANTMPITVPGLEDPSFDYVSSHCKTPINTLKLNCIHVYMDQWLLAEN